MILKPIFSAQKLRNSETFDLAPFRSVPIQFRFCSDSVPILFEFCSDSVPIRSDSYAEEDLSDPFRSDEEKGEGFPVPIRFDWKIGF